MFRLLNAVLVLFFVSSFVNGQAIYDRESRFHSVSTEFGNGMVVSQDAIASQVGAKIMEQGGNAIDAAVATGFALAVTFPQAGNIGGGGFMVVYLAESKETIALDYRETAPSAATKDMFLRDDGSVDERSKRFGGGSIGVPGTVAGLLAAQKRWGLLSIDEVIAPAIELAIQGFEVPSGLAWSLRRAMPRFQSDDTKTYFSSSDGDPLTTGERWRWIN